MHRSVELQFERIAQEFAEWRGVSDDERSPAPAWWWGPAMEALDEPDAMPAELCVSFELSPGSRYGDAAELLMKALAEQTSLSWPDEFPKKFPQPDPA
ncbi:hypothetical protein [uncultured Bradyrhizobium sp.]|uniref:hypothetical protein n=1 Tax=uncultured Bradyrhizobium sp. TaxID=199684 RepID=UPI0035CA9FB2